MVGLHLRRGIQIPWVPAPAFEAPVRTVALRCMDARVCVRVSSTTPLLHVPGAHHCARVTVRAGSCVRRSSTGARASRGCERARGGGVVGGRRAIPQRSKRFVRTRCGGEGGGGARGERTPRTGRRRRRVCCVRMQLPGHAQR